MEINQIGGVLFLIIMDVQVCILIIVVVDGGFIMALSRGALEYIFWRIL